MPRITKPAELRRQEIIDTARRLFMENGFDKTQVADISNSINAAQGLVYHYFKSKTDILYAVIDEISAEQTELMRQTLAKNQGSAINKLTLLFDRRPSCEVHNNLAASLKSDKAIVEYCTKKMTVSTMPLLLSLIESGNADGSWNCEYPMETAVFILQGFSGLMGFSQSPQVEAPKIGAFTNILFRILGVAEAQNG